MTLIVWPGDLTNEKCVMFLDRKVDFVKLPIFLKLIISFTELW